MINYLRTITFHSLLHILLKHPPVCLKLHRSLLVQGILRVGFLKCDKILHNLMPTKVAIKYQNKGTHQEEILKAIDYGVDCQHRFPVLEDPESTIIKCFVHWLFKEISNFWCEKLNPFRNKLESPLWGCWGRRCPQGRCWGGTPSSRTSPGRKSVDKLNTTIGYKHFKWSGTT